MGGLLAGAALFGFAYPLIYPPLAKIGNLGNITLPALWGLSPLLVVAVFVTVVLLLFYALERGWQRKDRLEG